jgi:hypothetical protein
VVKQEDGCFQYRSAVCLPKVGIPLFVVYLMSSEEVRGDPLLGFFSNIHDSFEIGK